MSLPGCLVTTTSMVRAKSCIHTMNSPISAAMDEDAASGSPRSG
jgi:hypothetical protein